LIAVSRLRLARIWYGLIPRVCPVADPGVIIDSHIETSYRRVVVAALPEGGVVEMRLVRVAGL